MLSNKNNLYFEKTINFLFCLFPISLIVGSLILNLNLFLLLAVSFLYLYNNKYSFTFSYTNIFLITFFIFIILTSLLNIESNNYKNSIKAILLLRFLFLYLIIETLLKKNKLDLKNFFLISLVCTVFVSSDVIFQYTFGFDVFGYLPWDGMIAGPFEHEAVAGTFLQKFSLFSIFGFILFFNNKNHSKKILLLIILLILFGAFFASNRISTVVLIASFFLLIAIYRNLRPTILLSLVIFATFSAILINNDDVLKKKYQHLYKRFFLKSEIVQKDLSTNTNSEINSKKKVVLSNSLHYRIYLTAIESWKNKPILGQGHKSFRTKCNNVISKNANFHCSTHPHNYHLQVLHDYGLIGYLLISLFIFSILFKIYKKLSEKKSIKKNYNIYFIPIIISLLMEIWPIKSTGDLFTTWNGATVWMVVSLSAILGANLKKENFNHFFKKNNLIFTYTSIMLSALIIKRVYLHITFYSWWDKIF